MLYEEWKSRYKNLKNFNTVLQRCPRFWPLAPPRGMNPRVYSLGISEDPPRYLSSKFDASVRSDCWDISIWKTLTQCDGNGNANANQKTGVTTIALLVLRTGELKIMWKRGEIAPEEQFLLFSTLFYIYISNFRSQITHSLARLYEVQGELL